MKFVLTIFLCLFSGSNAFAQSEESKINSAIGVEEISLARGVDGVDATDKFRTGDNPIFCFIQLDAEKPATVKMILVAVKAANIKPESKIVTVSYTTEANQNRVSFTASPNGGVWAAGDYRVDVYVGGKLAKSRTFVVEKSPQEIRKQKLSAPKSLAPRTNVKKPRVD